MKNYVLFFLLLISWKLNAQLITTIAGGGTSVVDGVAATMTSLGNPAGCVFDKNGNLFIAEVTGNRIRKISPAGIVTTVAGTGTQGYNGDGIPATAARLFNPSGVAVDSVGNLYIADCGNYRIRKVDILSGNIATIAGIGSSGFSGDGGAATNAHISIPYDICVDAFGNIYFTDNGNYRVRRIDVFGIISSFAGVGTLGSSGDGGYATDAQFMSIYGVQADKNGNIYVADWSGGKIRKINSLGIISTIVGTGVYTYNGENIPALNANLSPIRFTINSRGEMFIADYSNYRIRMVDDVGVIHSICGNGISGFTGDGGPALAAQLNGINGIAVDTCDNLYIAAHFSRIRKIAFNPECWPVGVDDVSKNNMNVSIYPNPANRELAITGAGINTIVITDAIGKKLISLEYKSTKKTEINISHLPPGMYLVRVNGVWVQRFLKQ